MKKNKNNINLTLTVVGLLGACGVANAEQVKAEQKPEAAKLAATPVKTEAAKPASAPVAAPTPVKAEAVTPASVKVEAAKPVAMPEPTPAKVESPTPDVEVKEVKKEVKKKEKFEKLQVAKAFAERQQFVEKYGKGKGLIIGIFPGSSYSLDTTTNTARHLPLANFLTTQANDLVSFSIESNVKTFKERAAIADFDMLYVNPEIAISAWRSGYDPIVQRSEKIVSVIFTRKNSNISKIKDLASAKVGGVPSALVSTLAKAKFKQENVKVDIVSAGSFGQKGLVTGLENTTFDAIIIREELANEIMAKEPDKYKIAIVVDESPGYILLAAKDLPAETTSNIVKSLTSIAQNPNGKPILQALDGHAGGFNAVNIKELEALEAKIKSAE